MVHCFSAMLSNPESKRKDQNKSQLHLLIRYVHTLARLFLLTPYIFLAAKKELNYFLAGNISLIQICLGRTFITQTWTGKSRTLMWLTFSIYHTGAESSGSTVPVNNSFFRRHSYSDHNAHCKPNSYKIYLYVIGSLFVVCLLTNDFGTNFVWMLLILKWYNYILLYVSGVRLLPLDLSAPVLSPCTSRVKGWTSRKRQLPVFIPNAQKRV